MFRFYNDRTHVHQYSANEHQFKLGSQLTASGEVRTRASSTCAHALHHLTSTVQIGHTYEGVSFYLYKDPHVGARPVYQWVNHKSGTSVFSPSSTVAGPETHGFTLLGLVGYGGCKP